MKLVRFNLNCRGQCDDAGVQSSGWAGDIGFQSQPFSNLSLRFGAMLAHFGPIPGSPVTPIHTMTNAATISVERVRPEMGWLVPPTNPTSQPPTAENRKPVRVMITAARSAMIDTTVMDESQLETGS